MKAVNEVACVRSALTAARLGVILLGFVAALKSLLQEDELIKL